MMPRVLLVDDDARLLSGMARHLRKQFQVELAGNAREGMELLGSTTGIAVVVSDYHMPGQNGIEFLTQARELAPDASRILLTGVTGLDTAIRAVNQGRVFRFLTKPCEPDVLELAIAAGARQYQLLQSERVLLEQTLTGSVEAMVELLGHLDPEALRRAQRVMVLVRRAASELGLLDLWHLTVAAPMSQMALLGLPAPVLERRRRGKPLTEKEEQQVFESYAAMSDVIGRIPRLEPVGEILRSLGTPAGEGERVPLSVQLLRGVIDLVEALDQGIEAGVVLERWRGSGSGLEPAVVEALGTVVARNEAFSLQHRQVRQLPVHELRLGHLLVSPIRTHSGRTVLPSGVVLDTLHLECIRDMAGLLEEAPVEVIDPLLTGGSA